MYRPEKSLPKKGNYLCHTKCIARCSAPKEKCCENGYSEKKIISLASEYKQGKIDIFDDRDKRRIALSMMSHEEEVRLLQDKIKALENALKLSNIKVEGYEIMMHILKDEYGIDLSKKAEAGQSTNSKGDTRK